MLTSQECYTYPPSRVANQHVPVPCSSDRERGRQSVHVRTPQQLQHRQVGRPVPAMRSRVDQPRAPLAAPQHVAISQVAGEPRRRAGSRSKTAARSPVSAPPQHSPLKQGKGELCPRLGHHYPMLRQLLSTAAVCRGIFHSKRPERAVSRRPGTSTVLPGRQEDPDNTLLCPSR